MIERIGILVIVIISLSGCTKVKHLPQLITLKSYSEEQESLEDFVHNQDDLFAQMLADIGSGDIKLYPTEEMITGKYGDPIYAREEQRDGMPVMKLLYRNQKEFFGSEKVYIYFDKKGQLLDLDYVPGEKEEQ